MQKTLVFSTLLQMPVDRVIMLLDTAKFPERINTVPFKIDGLLIEKKKKKQSYTT